MGVVARQPANACSSFFMVANGEMIFGNTLDAQTEEGLIFLNKRNVTKRGMNWFPGAPVWTSQYASLTINQWGRDFPSRGMNEAGLVFGEMNLEGSRYPAVDGRAPMEGRQWMQYMLDTCATVEEVLAAERRVRIDIEQYPSHFLVADRNGHVLSLEWLNGQLVCHTGEAMPIPALTNDTYANILAAYRANPQPVPGKLSAARFSRVADMLARYNPATDGSVAAQVFRILESLENPGWTKWKLAFDVRRGRLIYQTLQNRELRYVEMARLDFSPSSSVPMLDVNAPGSGDVTAAFVDFTYQANREVVLIAAKDMGFGTDPPWLRDFYNFPATSRVATGDATITGVRDVFPGGRVLLSAAPVHVSGAECQWQIDLGAGWRDVRDGADHEFEKTVFSGSSTATLEIANVASALDGANVRCLATRSGLVSPSPASRLTVALPPSVPSVPVNCVAPTHPGETVTITASTRFVNGNPGHAYRWERNGVEVPGAMEATLTLANFNPGHAGLYVATVTGTTSRQSEPVVVGLATSAKVTGDAEQLEPHDIVHPNGHIFDQVLLFGSAAALTADAGQTTRASFIDLDGDVVQVEFSGPGTLSLVLAELSPPALPAKYNQAVRYVTGHAGIVITGATEQTNVSVFSVGRATAMNQALFKADVQYDGIADIAFIPIKSANGKFGGVRAANANFFAGKGATGVYAPGVEFTGPVYVGEVSAFDAAKPVLVLGSASDVRITGGDLHQDNAQAVRVNGITRLNFTAGSDSHGRELPTQPNRAVLTQDGVDVTALLVRDS